MVGLLAAIIVGAIAGSLASQLVPGLRLGLLGDTLVGIAGALLGSLLFPWLHLHLGGGVIASIIAVTPAAIVGAVNPGAGETGFHERLPCELSRPVDSGRGVTRPGDHAPSTSLIAPIGGEK